MDGEIERKKQLVRPRNRWDNIIMVDLKSVCLYGVRNWAQNREKWLAFVKSVIKFRLFMKCVEFLECLRKYEHSNEICDHWS
jgi:hypothetical protein